MELPWNHQQRLLARIGHDPAQALQLVKHSPLSRGRAALEAFIRARFAEHYGARIRHFMPCLLGLEDAAGQPQAAVGLRSAVSGPLFLERYLERPIEVQIARANGVAPPREQIVEVGNLGALGAGHGRLLIVALTDLLVAQGFSWVAFTGTPGVLNSFQRLGLSPLALGEADPACMGDELADWGSYYTSRPQVMAGHILGGHRRLLALGLYRRLGHRALYAAAEVPHVACG